MRHYNIKYFFKNSSNLHPHYKQEIVQKQARIHDSCDHIRACIHTPPTNIDVKWFMIYTSERGTLC